MCKILNKTAVLKDNIPMYSYSSDGRGGEFRDERMDAVKFWLIVLVIAVHVFMRKEFADLSVCAALSKWILIFCMPSFIFISGYYSRKKDNKIEFWRSIWKLLEPLIIYHVIGLVFYVKHPLSISNILTPWFVLWYLLTLIYYRFILQIIPDKLLAHSKQILAIAFCFSILAGFLPFNRILSLQRTLSLMPFFFLGYYMKGKSIFLLDKYKLLCMVFLTLIFALLFFFSPNIINDLKYAFPYGNIYGAAIRMIAFAFAIFMFLAFMTVCYKAPLVARQGKMTMYYYILHALIISPLMKVVGYTGLSMSFVLAAVICIVITVGIGVVLNIPYFKMFTNPSLLFRK